MRLSAEEKRDRLREKRAVAEWRKMWRDRGRFDRLVRWWTRKLIARLRNFKMLRQVPTRTGIALSIPVLPKRKRA